MTPGVPDHLLAVVIVVVLPLYGVWEFRGLRRGLLTGRDSARVHAYRLTMLVEWLLAAVVVGVWLQAGRPLPSLGLGARWGLGPGIALLSVLVMIGLALWQNVHVLSTAERRDSAREDIRSMADMLPHTARERRFFMATSVTAGFCEELLYRGFLLQYLLPGYGGWTSVALTALVFGLGHAYQGVGGVLKTGMFGLVMAGVVVLGGSIWPAVILHGAVDIISGELGWRLLGAGSRAHAAPPEAPADPDDDI